MDFWTIINSLIPVISLVALGKLLSKRGILKDSSLHTLKTLIVNIGLPAVMFISFLEVSLAPQYLFIVVGMFLLNLTLLQFGKIAARWTGSHSDRFLFTGFEYGMLAYALFALVYGEANVPYIALVVLGHELFIWFIYAPLLQQLSGKKSSWPSIIKGLLTSPIIIAILLGLAFNLTGLGSVIQAAPLLSGLHNTIKILGSLTGPLILLVLGGGLFFSRRGLKKAGKVILLRLSASGLLIYLVGYILFQRILGLPMGFTTALAVLLISPPPYIIPIFLPSSEKHQEINVVLTLYTYLSLILFLGIVFLVPTL